MKPKFEIIFLEQAIDFVSRLDSKTRRKIYYNLDKARFQSDPKLFKKLSGEIWEFRTQYQGVQYRLFAFWDKSDNSNTLVISTHGIIKKVSKVPPSEIRRAIKIRTYYFDINTTNHD